MTPKRHETHDRLLAEIRLVDRRLARLGDQLAEHGDGAEDQLVELHAELTADAAFLADEVRSWTEVEIGVPTALDQLIDGVDALESDIAMLSQHEPGDFEVTVDRQLRAWRGRIDRLQVQGALGSMDAKDNLAELAGRLDRVRGDVLVELEQTADDAKTVVVDLRHDVEVVLSDVRRAIGKTVRDLTD